MMCKVGAVVLCLVLVLMSGASSMAQTNSWRYAETGFTVQGRFLSAWQQGGGLARFGYPISAELRERSAANGQTYTTQYFERAVFELHPENQPPYDVQFALLGRFHYQQKYANGAPNQIPSNAPDANLFAETGKRVGGAFLSYWQRGGLASYGLPLTDEFFETSELDSKRYKVQYFERAVFELHPENSPPYDVLLSQLGTQRYRAVYAAAGTLRPIAAMNTPRSCHTATLLANGKVLIAAGMVRDNEFTASAELYDPTTERFSATGSLHATRSCHTATLLPNGKVLIVGGYGNGYLASAELYDPSSGSFSPTGSMNIPREAHTATLLPNGKLLITGGSSALHQEEATAELYDPTSGKFSRISSMNAPRTSHTATLLPDGKVLIAGGANRSGVLASVEIYDSASGQFIAAGAMHAMRYKHAAALLPSGQVLIVGGGNSLSGRAYYASAELYNETSTSFADSGAMDTARFKFRDAVASLPDGRVVIAGDGKQVEIYNPTSDSFSRASGEMDAARAFMTATTLADGKVLISGGYDNRIVGSAAAWLYQP